MAAITGRREFIDNLTGFLKKANLSNTAVAWYSFYPHTNQSSYEFVFNDLLEEGASFVKSVTGAIIINPGGGYGSTETPTVTFTSSDDGSFASGTAVMSFGLGTAPASGNLIFNSDFSLANSGWYTGAFAPIQAPVSGQDFIFTGGRLIFPPHPTTGFSTQVTLKPNSGIFMGISGSGLLLGSIDISGATGNNCPNTIIGVSISGSISGVFIPHGLVSVSATQTQTVPFVFNLVPNDFGFANAIITPYIEVQVDNDPGCQCGIDNFIVYTGIGGQIMPLVNQLSKAWLIDPNGTNLIYNGNFRDFGTGWYLNSGGLVPAGNAGAFYVFNNGANLIVTSSQTSAFTLYPNSGTLQITGNGNWVAGSIDVIGPDSLTTLSVGGFNINITTAGRKYFAYYLPTGTPTFPGLSFTVQNGSSAVFDNFNLSTGWVGPEIISGLPNETIQRVIPDSDGNYWSGITAKNSLGLYKGAPPAASPATLDVKTSGGMLQTPNTTITFWHYFKNQNGGFPVLTDSLIAAWWPGFEFHITNYKYRLRNVVANNQLLTTIQPSSGWHLIAMGLSQPTPSSPVTQFLSIDNQMFSGAFPSGFIYTNPVPTIRFFGPQDNYDVGIDHLLVYNRALTTGEIRLLWNGGTGAFYPFGGLPAATGSRYVSNIAITNGGFGYITPPTITIAAPSGTSGVQAKATALLGPDTSRIYAESYPGLSVGGTNAVITGMQSGSGIFFSGNNDFLRVGNHIPFDNFTAFINFGPSGHVKGTSQVLLASMDSGHQHSGFILSINDARRIVFEYIDTTGSLAIRRHRIHDEELGKNNIIAISKDVTHSTLTIAIHDLADHDTRSKSYPIRGYTDSNVLYLGGFPNSGNNTNYTGFAGRLYDFLLLDGAANAVQCDALSKAFFTTGYRPSGTTGIQTFFSIVTGVVFQTVVTGSGITGYSLGAISIPDKDGTNITVYDISPLTGNFSGSGIVYLSGTSSGVRITQSGTPEVFYYSNAYIRQYAEDNIVFLNYSIVPTDMLQIYSFSDKQIDRVSVIPQPFNLNDYYLLDSFSPESLALVFNDGLLQLPGVDYGQDSGKILSSGLSAFRSTYNFILYDEVSGNMYSSGWTGWSGAKQIIGTGKMGWRSNAGIGAAAQPDGSQEAIFDSSFQAFDTGIGGIQAYVYDSTKPIREGDILTISGEGSDFARCQDQITLNFGILTPDQGFVLLAEELVNLGGGTGNIIPAFVAHVVINIPVTGYPAFQYFSTYTGDFFDQNIEIYKIDSAVTQNRDIYLNGQKLVSGFDYLSTGSGITLTGIQNGLPVVWASGTFVFTNSRTGNRSIFTGASGIGYSKVFSGLSVAPLMDEMVWLNGQRLAPDFDYKTVSSESLLLTSTRPSVLSFQLYTGDIFPLSILTGKPNI